MYVYDTTSPLVNHQALIQRHTCVADDLRISNAQPQDLVQQQAAVHAGHNGHLGGGGNQGGRRPQEEVSGWFGLFEVRVGGRVSLYRFGGGTLQLQEGFPFPQTPSC